MLDFIRQYLADLGLLLLFSIPVLVIAWRHGRKKLFRNFLIAAATVAVLSAIIGASSAHLVEQCGGAGAVGAERCVDLGSAGIRVLLLGGYILTALAEAYLLSQD